MFVFLLHTVAVWRSGFLEEAIVMLLLEISAQWNTL